MVFLIMILVILAFVVMWNFDVHKIVSGSLSDVPD